LKSVSINFGCIDDEPLPACTVVVSIGVRLPYGSLASYSLFCWMRRAIPALAEDSSWSFDLSYDEMDLKLGSAWQD